MSLQPPQPEDVVALRGKHGLTQSALADMAHASARTVQNWEAPAGTTSYRQMPAAVWELLLAKLGEIPLDTSNAPKAIARRERRSPKPAAKPTPPPATDDAVKDRIQRLREQAKKKLG